MDPEQVLTSKTSGAQPPHWAVWAQLLYYSVSQEATEATAPQPLAVVFFFLEQHRQKKLRNSGAIIFLLPCSLLIHGVATKVAGPPPSPHVQLPPRLLLWKLLWSQS